MVLVLAATGTKPVSCTNEVTVIQPDTLKDAVENVMSISLSLHTFGMCGRCCESLLGVQIVTALQIAPSMLAMTPGSMHGRRRSISSDSFSRFECSSFAQNISNATGACQPHGFDPMCCCSMYCCMRRNPCWHKNAQAAANVKE